MTLKKFTTLVVVSVGLALTAQAERPKLIVAIAVDQLRYDYLERFNDQFGPGGFKLFTEKGAFMTFARYNYAPTITGPGHASFLSGTTPAWHGIIGNDWFDKTTKKMINCVDDLTVSGVGTVGKPTDKTGDDESPSGAPAVDFPAGKKSPVTSSVGRSPISYVFTTARKLSDYLSKTGEQSCLPEKNRQVRTGLRTPAATS